MEAVSSMSGKKSTNVRSEGRVRSAAKNQEYLEKAIRGGFSVLAPLSTALSAAAAEKLFFKAFRFPASEREQAILRTGHRMTFTAQGQGETVELACWSWGDGPSVFLLHGWSGRAGQLGAFVAPLVEAGYSVIAFDAPAHGQSTGKHASAVAFARALAQVIKRFGPAHAVIAHSMGGWAAAYALLEGTPIERSVLIGSPTDPTSFTRQFSERFGLSDEVINRMMARAEKRIGLQRQAFELTSRVGGPLGASSQALIVHDRGDSEVAFVNASNWAASWPKASLLATEGLGHHLILRDRAVIQKVLEFVKTGAVQKSAD